MASIGTSAVKIIDNDNDVVSVTGNRLDVRLHGTFPDGTTRHLICDNGGFLITETTVDSTVQAVGYGTVSHVARNVTDSAVQLASLACKHVDIMATIANTGIVYMGASGVSATTGIGLYPGDVYSVDITNTNLLYAISTVDGDDINIVVYS
jgi:hypothetical protein